MSHTSLEDQVRLANTVNTRVLVSEEGLLGRERSEKALEDSEKRYRRLFESAKDGILILDAETGRVVDVNPFLMELLGYSHHEFIGKYIWEIGVFKDIASSKDAFKKLQNNDYIRYENLPLETSNGQPIAVEFVSNVYLVDQRRVIQCNIRDITKRRRAEIALAESEAKLHSILDNIGIGVALISPEMEILELNQRMRDWFPDIEPGQHPTCYRTFNDPPRDSMCESCPTQKTLQDGLVHEGITQTERKGGIRNYRIVSSPISNPSGEVTAVIEMVEDITEKLSLESQFRQAQKMEAVGQLAGGVAHDFNNMLGVILGYAELARCKVDPGHPLHADLEEIHKAAKRSVAITQQLLAFARKQMIAPVVLDLNQRIEGTLKMLRRLVGENISLAWLPKSNLNPVKIDPAQVDQILVNLCVNARDAFVDVGQITILTESVVFDESYYSNSAGFIPGEYVVLTVCDDGCGMDKQTLDRIFEPFFTSKGIGQGTGLGLATVYGIVKQNNGFIKVYSEPGFGTNFEIYLPQFENQHVDTYPEMPSDIPVGLGETVLLVEDEPSILTIAKRMLEKLGYRVLASATPGEAVAMAEKHSKEIHLLITDVIMPEMNGRILADRLKSLYPGIKNLFMSGYTADVIAHRGVLNEGVNFIQKPFSLEALAFKVREAIAEQ